jgi:hypothetical protein
LERTLLDGLEDLLNFLGIVGKRECERHKRAARLLAVFSAYDLDERVFGSLLELGLERIDHLDITLDLLLLLVLLALLHAVHLGALLLLLLLLFDVFRHCRGCQLLVFGCECVAVVCASKDVDGAWFRSVSFSSVEATFCRR